MCAAYFHQTHPQQAHPNQDQKMPQVAQQLANVVTSSTQYRMNGVTQLAFEPIALQFPIRLHVTNGGFNRTATFDFGFEASGNAPPLA